MILDVFENVELLFVNINILLIKNQNKYSLFRELFSTFVHLQNSKSASWKIQMLLTQTFTNLKLHKLVNIPRGVLQNLSAFKIDNKSDEMQIVDKMSSCFVF